MSTYINSSHLKNQFAHRFVQALNNLNNKQTSPQENHMNSRSRRVKIASYTAMASVVGTRRAWSRAVLWKIRNRTRVKFFILRKRKRVTKCHHHAKVYVKRRNPNPKREDFDRFSYSSQESRLRKLVPGSETMDSWCLIGETADYIKCLAAQVEVMKTLVDFYTTT